MGNICTHTADALAHMVTQNEIQEAVRSIEEWQKAQTSNMKNGAVGLDHGPLLQRVGGPNVVRQVVELFYKKMFADPRLIRFLHDQDVLHLRAKQSAFVAWLFGPPNMPYTGRSVRIAHLRIIKQRGFAPEDFDQGMRYFEEAMRELGAPENIMGEVMRRMWPFKDAFFTHSPKDAEEEARWAAEERMKEEEAQRLQQEAEHQAQLAAQHSHLHTLHSMHPHHANSHLHTSQHSLHPAGSTQSLGLKQSQSGVAPADDGAPNGAAGAGSTAARGSQSGAGAAVSRPASLGPQCPFTGGRLSRPGSAAPVPTAAAAAVPTAASSPAAGGAAAAAAPGTSSRPSTAQKALAAAPAPAAPPSQASRPASASGVAVTLPSSTRPGSSTAGPASSARPSSRLAPQPASSSRPASSAPLPAPPASARQGPASAPLPVTTSSRPGSSAPQQPTSSRPGSTVTPAVPDPVTDFEAALDEIERAALSPEELDDVDQALAAADAPLGVAAAPPAGSGKATEVF